MKTGLSANNTGDARNELLDLDVLGNLLSYYVRTFDVYLSRHLEERLTGLEVVAGKGKITVLLLVDGHPGVRPSKIAETMSYDKSVLTRIVESLRLAGLITMKVSKEDGRARELYITPEGAEIAARLRIITVEHSEDFFDQLITQKEHDIVLNIFRKALERIRDNRQ